MNLLHVFANRIPLDLQDLVREKISRPEFSIKSMTYETPADEQRSLFRWADAVLFTPGRKLDSEVIKAGNNIKLFQVWSSGYDKFNMQAVHEMRIPLANNGGSNADAVAEHGFLLLMALCKKLPEFRERVLNASWAGNCNGMSLLELNRKKIGVLGFGRIGSRVGRIANGFGMNVQFFDPYSNPETERAAPYARKVSFDEIIETSDIISIHLHLNNENRSMINEEVFSKMKDGVILINTSRAELVNRDALIASIESGRLRGYGADVHYQEPNLKDDPLYQFKNVIATPHIAGSTYDTHLKTLDNCISNLLRVRENKKPLWVVNPETLDGREFAKD